MTNEIKRYSDILELKRYSYQAIESYVYVIERLKYFSNADSLDIVADSWIFKRVVSDETLLTPPRPSHR